MEKDGVDQNRSSFQGHPLASNTAQRNTTSDGGMECGASIAMPGSASMDPFGDDNAARLRFVADSDFEQL